MSMTKKLNQLNALEKKEMYNRADDLFNNNKKKGRHFFNRQEIEILLVNHWLKMHQLALGQNQSVLISNSIDVSGNVMQGVNHILSDVVTGLQNNKANKPKGFNRNQFREILHKTFNMTEDLLMDRVFKTFDRNNDGLIDDKEWVEGLAIFLKGSLEDKINYTFTVYDINGDGYISRDEMFQMLKTCQVRQTNEEDPDEGIKDLVEIALRKMDLDKDSRLSRNDFHDSIFNEPLLLEAFGPCLPDEISSEKFENEMFEEIRKNNPVSLDL